jgi:hypothetical protein
MTAAAVRIADAERLESREDRRRQLRRSSQPRCSGAQQSGRNLAEVGVALIADGICEIRMIEQIEELRAEL